MGAAIGFSPEQIDRMSMWQFFAAVDGYTKAHGAEDDGLSGAEQDEIWKLVERKTERLRDGGRH